jgi:hypothetical protein
MKAAFFAFALWFALAGSAFAQSIGEPLADGKGLTLQCPDGGSVNVRIADHRIQLYFLDSAGLVEKCPYQKVILRIDRPQVHNGDENLVLRPTDDVPYLTHPRFIEPPYIFQIHLAMYPAEDTDEGRVSLPQTMFRWTE